MLTVKTRLYGSNIEGLGVLTTQPIERGTIVNYVFAGLDLLLPALENFPESVQEYLRKHAFKLDGNYVLFHDNARYINHAKNANLVYYCASLNAVTCVRHFVAICDIPSGTELKLDYSEFDMEHYRRICNFVEKRDAKLWPPKVNIDELNEARNANRTDKA